MSQILQQKCFTVDEYQGLENDVIILSLVARKPSEFCNNLNRNLVAFSRAKTQMWVVGDLTEWDNEISQKLLSL